jgi:lipoate-protein ligase A
MKYCDLTLPSPEENLACDEVLLDECDSGREGPLLRFWEPSQYFVVVGYANSVASEVNRDFCTSNSIPILRRCTGGGTVLQGRGCLNYSLVLRLDEAEALHSIHSTNRFILERHREMFGRLLRATVETRGQTDLAIGGLKFAGNAQRRKRHALIFHGCMLLNLDIALVEKTLRMPSKQPDYRFNRSHADFLINLKLPAAPLKEALCKTWGAMEARCEIPFAEISRLAHDKYALDEWNLKF